MFPSHDRAGRADRVADILEAVRDVRVDRSGELRNTRLQDALSEVVQLHRQLGGREVDADVLLAGDRERGILLVVVLDLKRRAVRDQSAVGQADAEGRADLGALYSKRVIVLPINSAGQHEVVL